MRQCLKVLSGNALCSYQHVEDTFTLFKSCSELNLFKIAESLKKKVALLQNV